MMFKLDATLYQDSLHLFVTFHWEKALCLNKMIIMLVLTSGLLWQFVFKVIQDDNHTCCSANCIVTIWSTSCIFYCHIWSLSLQTFCKLIHLHRCIYSFRSHFLHVRNGLLVESEIANGWRRASYLGHFFTWRGVWQSWGLCGTCICLKPWSTSLSSSAHYLSLAAIYFPKILM